jgi:group I intron endonuclease
MSIGIYNITSPSGKVYIGSSVNIEKRWKQYKVLSCSNQPKLYRSFLKYGVDKHFFKIEIQCSIDELYEWEHHYSNYYNSVKSGLNCQVPGFNDVKAITSEETRAKIGLSSKGNKHWLGKKHSPETKAKIGMAHKGKVVSDETKLKTSLYAKNRPESVRKNISNSLKGKASWNKGIKMSDETKRRLSESHKGKTLSDEHKAKISNGGKGRKHSDETRLKLSISNKGQVRSEEAKQKMRDAWKKGRVISEETRKKQSESRIEYYKLKKQKIEI